MNPNCYILDFNKNNLIWVCDNLSLGGLGVITNEGCIGVSDFILVNLDLMIFSLIGKKEAVDYTKVKINELEVSMRDHKINYILDNE